MTFDASKFEHLQPETWAAWVAEYLDTNIASTIKRTVCPIPVQADAHHDADGVNVYFDNFYVAFDAASILDSESVQTVEDVRVLYLLPGVSTFLRIIEAVSPLADELFWHPSVPGVEQVYREHLSIVNNQALIKSTFYAADDGGLGISFDMMLGFKLKTPPADLDGYRAIVDERLLTA